MAIAIKSIPVLTGDTVKCFVAMADSNKRNTVTSIPESMRHPFYGGKNVQANFNSKSHNKLQEGVLLSGHTTIVEGTTISMKLINASPGIVLIALEAFLLWKKSYKVKIKN